MKSESEEERTLKYHLVDEWVSTDSINTPIMLMSAAIRKLSNVPINSSTVHSTSLIPGKQ